MIPAIGYMVGFYIFTKMLSLVVVKKGEEPENVIVIIFAVITMLVAVFGIALLVSGEFSLPNYLP